MNNILKQLLVFFAAAILAFSNITPALAVNTLSDLESSSEQYEDTTENDSDKEEEEEEEEGKEKKEKKSAPKDGKPVLGNGETGILIDAISGRTLYEKDSDKKMYPASTTKIMTALLAVEAVERGEVSMDTQIQITPEMLAGLDPEGTSMALIEGEVLTLEHLLRGLMIASGNDAANAIATHLGKSVAAFVDIMNARAEELGAKNTHFVNPHGLFDENHYTTAADMAKISHQAMKYFEFRNIVDIAHVKIPPTNKTENERYYINTNGLLSVMRYTDFFYKNSIGIKTGYTSEAGYCLVSAANRSGVELIGVVFGGKTVSDSHGDSAKLLDWGFENYISFTALQKNDMPCEIKVKQGKGTDSLTLSVPESVKVIVPKETKLEDLKIVPHIPDAVYAPIAANDKIGTVSVYLGDAEIGTGVLLANKSVERSFFWPVLALGEWLWSKLLVRIICYALIVTAVGFVLLFSIGMYRNIKRANRRKTKG